MVECGGLENRWGPRGPRGFESLPLRHFVSGKLSPRLGMIDFQLPGKRLKGVICKRIANILQTEGLAENLFPITALKKSFLGPPICHRTRGAVPPKGQL